MSGERKRGDGQHLVGYGRPPAEHRFQKGVSGNPKGRPRRAKAPTEPPPPASFDEAVIAEARRKIPIREAGRVCELSTEQALLRALAMKGLQGHVGALREFLRLTAAAQARTVALQSEDVVATLEYKAAWAERKRADPKATFEDPLTHPDDLQIDLVRGLVRVNGPRDHGERAEWASAQQQRAEALEEIAEYRAEARRRSCTPTLRAIFAGEIAFLKRKVRRCEAMYPSEEIRRAPGFDLRTWRMDHLSPLVEEANQRKNQLTSGVQRRALDVRAGAPLRA
jgi:hypothetical protein